MKLNMRQLNGLDYRSAELMGKPSIGAHYQREDYRSHRKDLGARCVICGKPATDAHHVVPRGHSRGFTVNTPLGQFSTLTPLFALCQKCHSDIHDRARYEISWKWKEERYQEEWWSGHTLAHICQPGSPWLFQEGCYHVTDRETGEEYEVNQPTPNIRKTERCARCGFDRPLKEFKTYRRPDGSYYRIKVCAECHEKSLGQ